MKTTEEHRNIAASAIENGGMTTLQIKEGLMKKGLTKSQANDVVRNQRKRLKVYGVKRMDDISVEDTGLKWGKVY